MYLYLKKDILQRNKIQTTNRILKETIPVIKLKDFGFRIAGHNSLRKMKPLKPKKKKKKNRPLGNYCAKLYNVM